MARRRRPEAQPLDDEPPPWFWQFRQSDWGQPQSLDDIVSARGRWRERRDAWLQGRGLIMWSMRGLTFEEFKRIEREEPHRILRRNG